MSELQFRDHDGLWLAPPRRSDDEFDPLDEDVDEDEEEDEDDEDDEDEDEEDEEEEPG